MLNSLIFFPFFAACIALFLKKDESKIFAILVSFFILVLNLFLLYKYQDGIAYEFGFSFLIMNYHIGVNAIALYLMLLCSLMIFLSFVCLKIQDKSIVVSIFILEFCMMGLFASLDAILFYIFWEFSLIPLIYLIGRYSSNYQAGIKFFIYAFCGSMLMLLAILYIGYLYFQSFGYWSFDLIEWYKSDFFIPEYAQNLIFLGFFIAFAIKSPLFPFHTWAPSVYAKSPTLVSVMLVSFKMAPFGIITFILPLTPDVLNHYHFILVVLCIVGILYAALIAFKTKDLKELIAYSSISHLAVVILGIITVTHNGLNGAIFYMFAHGIVTGGLFLAAYMLYQRYYTYEIDFYKNLAKKSPLYSLFFGILMLSSISLPLSISFVGEFLILQGIAGISLWYALLAGIVIILGAIYMLNIYRNMFFFPQVQEDKVEFKLSKSEIFVLILLSVIIIYFGIAPSFILEQISDNVNVIFETMQMKNNILENQKIIDSVRGL
ncbi:NADH-quinone oxidoreductase subunit M [Campylobacter insulaenigrae]|uniref:complex I subunit 4 family protein n=1 Tax=Campylobacter insulaenigrae TaxID=260714 RepID=UPI00215261AE|nr:NADH-quinone oxidoreductase subunit M [Campylobacter insulaenigrae]MCR6571003.1 NADH-quinone oxidoreductase subunit M [Campylobacter insulaenigrae]MCR6572577.1 NADH-quinone oxidoreductase subunit M [Campylobacter insulaenigrae]MCR6573937.1 NADH-quinone oxidoreductase subunit M [Campylobacter insulaenigrae]MCR6575669.1 NADH-quinone oxidoreductase subunit M [Campylobacter insulaenigrae]MCR6576951.1 NADH-quinone oxidoreductase subunit M [Campylobacter insulaenigrae]